MSEGTLKRIAAALERIADAKKGKNYVPAGPLDWTVCYFCGGPSHGENVPCPLLKPVAGPAWQATP